MTSESVSPSEKGAQFESQVADIYRRLGADVKHDVSLAGNQIDLLITETTDSGSRTKAAVECKAYNRSVGVGVINDFGSQALLLRNQGLIDRAVVVAPNGFSRQARDAADEYNIDLLEIEDLQQQVGFYHAKENKRRGFIPNLRDEPEDLPNRLTGETNFVGRNEELEKVRDRLRPKGIVTITGPPKSGKQRLVGQVLTNLESGLSDTYSKDNNVSLLYAKIRSDGIQFPVVQSLARALEVEVEKDVRSNIDIPTGVGEPDDFGFLDDSYSSSREFEAQRLLGKVVFELEDLLDETDNDLVAVFAEAEQVLEAEPTRKKLDQFLAEDPFHSGAAIICTRLLSSVSVDEVTQLLASTGGHKRVFHQPIQLGPLSQEEATSLLSQFVRDRDLVEDEVEKMAVNEEPALFYPGTLCNVGQLFQIVADPRGEKLHRIWLRSYLNEPVTEYIRRVGGSIIGEKNDKEGPLATLFSMALLPNQAINEELIEHANLVAPSWQQLYDENLLTRTDNGFVLTSLGQFLLRTEISFRYQKEESEGAPWKDFANAFEKLLSTLSVRRGGYDNSRDFGAEMEDARQWINEKLSDEKHISGLLKEMLSLLAADNVLLPFSRQEVESLVERQREIGEKERLNTTLTELIHATRYLESTDSFLTIFEKAVGQANAEPYLTGHQVRALDRAGFRRRHKRFNDAFLEQRLKLIDKLVNEVDESTENDTNLVKWATSWIMNATGLAISVGEISTAQRLLQQASEVTERFTNLVGRYGQTDQAWIKCRFLQLGSGPVVC